MKKTLAFLCIVVIVATTLLPLIALADTRYVYTKDGKSLNLRQQDRKHSLRHEDHRSGIPGRRMGLREVWEALRLRDEQVSVGSETAAQEDPDYSPVMPARLRQEAHCKNPDDRLVIRVFAAYQKITLGELFRQKLLWSAPQCTMAKPCAELALGCTV
mgnify:CR=1 FL=1